MKKLVGLKGLNALTNEQLKHINGGGKQRCQTLEIIDEPYGPYNGDVTAPYTCHIRCRDTFLGIGVGPWTYDTVPCG